VRVDGREGVVQQVDVGVTVDGARECHTGFLSAREVDTALACAEMMA
jgi:hypothetical protein